ncbi:HIT family protein [Acidipropionibacterium acidipropionici]|uniref:HIT family protein n=1 Tax=Acidipropionibacterium acidipropionici TaxID=1748 RepID=UPI001C2FBDB0|nr:HIT family protein [Acidipropionibacterium acidipropionici]
MASVFTKIIRHEIPARIIWEDDVTVAFLDAHPQAYGHTLVVPREEIDEWTDMPTDLSAHLFRVVSSVGKAQRDVFDCATSRRRHSGIRRAPRACACVPHQEPRGLR